MIPMEQWEFMRDCAMLSGDGLVRCRACGDLRVRLNDSVFSSMGLCGSCGFWHMTDSTKFVEDRLGH